MTNRISSESQQTRLTSRLANERAPHQAKTLHERGIRLTTLQYTRKEGDGSLSHRRMLIPTDKSILPALQPLYSDTLKLCPFIRSQLRPGCDAHFWLVSQKRLVGCFTLDLSDFSDRDLAWLNCIFAEIEGAVLEFFGSMPDDEIPQ